MNKNNETYNERQLNITVDKVPYSVSLAAFDFNSQVRYHVTINGGTEHVFAWDEEVRKFRAIDDQSTTIPDALMVAISDHITSSEK